MQAVQVVTCAAVNVGERLFGVVAQVANEDIPVPR